MSSLDLDYNKGLEHNCLHMHSKWSSIFKLKNFLFILVEEEISYKFLAPFNWISKLPKDYETAEFLFKKELKEISIRLY